jgi:hypothetical protein
MFILMIVPIILGIIVALAILAEAIFGKDYKLILGLTNSLIYLLSTLLAVCFKLYALIPLLYSLPLLYLFAGMENLEIKSIHRWVERDSIRNGSDSAILGQEENRKLIEMNSLWKEYRELGMPGQRFLRTLIGWLIFMSFSAYLMHIFPEPLSLCRGNTCFLDSWVFIFCVSIVMFLIFLVLDAQRLCLHWIEKICLKHPLLADITRLDESTKSTATSARDKNDADVSQELEKIIRIVAERTYAVDRLIYFPIIVLMLMFLARIAYFDYLDFPISNGIIALISILLLLYAGLKLRTEASELKLAVIDNAPNPRKMIKKLEKYNYGAFQSMSEQPVVRSALLLLGSLGLFAAEYLMLFGY